MKFFSGEVHKENIRCAKVRAKQTASALHKACKPEAIPSTLVSVGTDCSGMEAPIQALRNLTPYFGHRHLFSCDNDKGVRKTINANFANQLFYEDVMTRDNRSTPYVDLYVAGFPCQPFSSAGRQAGFDDFEGRGIIFWGIHDYISLQRPKVFILENVEGITSLENGKYMKFILKVLHRIGGGLYDIHHEVLNTRDHGVPQNRKRWYCVGIRQGVLKSDKNKFSFPDPIPCQPIQDFLDARGDPEQEQGSILQNIVNAQKRIRDSGKDPNKTFHIVDCDASAQRSRSVEGYSPCITRSRSRGHWISAYNRRFNMNEMFRLQGMNPTTFKVAVSPRELGQQIGNSMSINVIERIILKALKHADLIPQDVPDEWESGIRVKELLHTKTKSAYPQKHEVIHSNKRKCAHLGLGDHTRRYIVDSGASIHLVDLHDLTVQERSAQRKMKKAIHLTTANGGVQAEYETDVYVQELDIWVVAVLLENTPPVLSLGKLVDEHTLRYIWEPNEIPYLENAQGTQFRCFPTHNVPFITVGTQVLDTGGGEQAADTQPQLDEARSDPEQSVQTTPEVRVDCEPVPKARAASKKASAKPKIRKKKSTQCSPCAEHNLFTHFPKDSNCDVCNSCKTQRAQCRSSPKTRPDAQSEPKAYADSVTLDHAILNEEDQSRDQAKVACIIQEAWSQRDQAS
ncbi:MAG: DNA (cytosine-5-)-methyltransferase [Opitutales bacterium]|nr:DNA (cytosine-5-)-methyltransferase [Opitutales bacterium]